MLKRFRHFVRGLHAAYLQKKFALLDREIKWNADRFDEVMRALRESRRRTAASLRRAGPGDAPPPDVIVCAGDMRFPMGR